MAENIINESNIALATELKECFIQFFLYRDMTKFFTEPYLNSKVHVNLDDSGDVEFTIFFRQEKNLANMITVGFLDWFREGVFSNLTILDQSITLTAMKGDPILDEMAIYNSLK